MAARRRTTVRAAVLPARRGLPGVGRLLPSPRSLATGIVLLVLAGGAYLVARETSIFAVREIEVVGASPRVVAEVRAALAPVRGRSLLLVDAAVVGRRVSPVPDVRSVTFDRAFPHTLRVVVEPERPVLLLRRGSEGWVVSARGRVLRRVRNPRLSSLPRLWVPQTTRVAPGVYLAPGEGASAAAALAPIARLPHPIHVVRIGKHELTLVLRGAPEVRLGDVGDLRLKLAIARRILLTLPPDATGYLDVSVPERPVVGETNPQVGG